MNIAKKIIVAALITAFALLAACGSSPGAVNTAASGPDELDAAIREASDNLNANAVNDNSAQEIGKLLGAQTIVSGY